MNSLVECRSDHAYLGYPLAFYWQGVRLQVNEVLSEHQSPKGYSFRVRSEDQFIFILDYDINTDLWSVEQI